MTDIAIGDIVEAKGYGGFAKVVNMVEDGVAFGGQPKYLCTVVFGPYNGKLTHCKTHEFYAGSLTKVDADATGSAKQTKAKQGNTSMVTKEQILARLAEINAKLGAS